MTEAEKVEILKRQLEWIRRNESESDRLKAEIIRLGYSPDKATW